MVNPMNTNWLRRVIDEASADDSSLPLSNFAQREIARMKSNRAPSKQAHSRLDTEHDKEEEGGDPTREPTIHATDRAVKPHDA
jgi:hypothetical protein